MDKFTGHSIILLYKLLHNSYLEKVKEAESPFNSNTLKQHRFMIIIENIRKLWMKAITNIGS